MVLTRTHSRVPWVPAEVVLRHETDPVLRHVLAAGSWPAGTAAVAALLDELGVPLDETARGARAALRAAGRARRMQVVNYGLKFRRARSAPGNTSGNTLAGVVRETSGTTAGDATSPQAAAGELFPGNTGKRARRAVGNTCPSLEGHSSSTAPETTYRPGRGQTSTALRTPGGPRSRRRCEARGLGRESQRRGEAAGRPIKAAHQLESAADQAVLAQLAAAPAPRGVSFPLAGRQFVAPDLRGTRSTRHGVCAHRPRRRARDAQPRPCTGRRNMLGQALARALRCGWGGSLRWRAPAPSAPPSTGTPSTSS